MKPPTRGLVDLAKFCEPIISRRAIASGHGTVMDAVVWRLIGSTRPLAAGIKRKEDVRGNETCATGSGRRWFPLAGLVLLLMTFCVSGCQISGGFDESNQISLAPAPALKPVPAFNAKSYRAPNPGSTVDRKLTLLNGSSVYPNPLTRSLPSQTASPSGSFNSPLTNRLRESRSAVALSQEAAPTAVVNNAFTQNSFSSSRQVAFQGEAEALSDAAKIPSDLTLPFEDNETEGEKETENEDGLSYKGDQSSETLNASTEISYNSNSLGLAQVVLSVKQCYPEIDIAIGEIEQAQGKILSSWGEFDSTFDAYSISKPLGFYEQYRNGTGVTRPLYSGGEVYGGYRIGRGTFEPWYGERETDQAGEFKVGFSKPLLKDRDIDKRRASLIAAGFVRDQVEANVETRLLQFERFAAQAYWDWVASGQAVVIQQQLLNLAQTRVEQISLRIEQGDLAKIAEIDNDRFIAKRKNTLIKARRGLEKAAIKLSMFFRDGNCEPVIVDEQRLPLRFPLSDEIDQQLIQGDIGIALQTRPELVELAAARREACLKLQYATNLLLPKLDLKGFAGKDIGDLTSSKGDKRPLELEIGVFAEVPIQRREGAGKIQSAQGKITQIDAKRRLVSDKIRAEIQDAASAVNAAFKQIRQSRENVRLNEQSLELGRLAFDEGDIDLLALNIYESSVADAKLQLLEAQHKYFYSLAIYQTITSSEAFLDR